MKELHKFLVSIFLVQGLLAGFGQSCSEITVTESWNGGYNLNFLASSPVSATGLVVKFQFDNDVDVVEVWQLDVVSVSGKYVTLQNTGWVLQTGQNVDFAMTVRYSGGEANIIGISINDVSVCGDGGGGGGGESGCEPTGTGPYDYKQALCMSFLFYEAQRSGYLPADRRVTWRWDSATGDGDDVGLDLTGGYYDAGDHVKFGFPMAFTTTFLAWGMIDYAAGYDAAGQTDYGRAAIRWATDYFLKAHSSGHTLYGQLGQGGPDHAYWGRPEEMTMYRPAYKIDDGAPGSDLAGETAAALAAASMVFKDVDPGYSTQCLDAARDLFDFADSHRQTYDQSITDAQDFYKSWSGYNDELGWSAAWMAKATGESSYLEKAKGFYDEFGLGNDPFQFGWDNKMPGVISLMLDLTGDGKYRDHLDSWTNKIRNYQTSPQGMVVLDPWGTLRHAANVAFVLLKAADSGINTGDNTNFAMQQLHYILGSTGRSFVVGFGVNPPQRPHHRASSCPNPPNSCTDGWAINQGGPNPQVLYGALVGGPDEWDNYSDDRNDYVKNEVACDYNAGFTGALAAAIQHLGV